MLQRLWGFYKPHTTSAHEDEHRKLVFTSNSTFASLTDRPNI